MLLDALYVCSVLVSEVCLICKTIIEDTDITLPHLKLQTIECTTIQLDSHLNYRGINVTIRDDEGAQCGVLEVPGATSDRPKDPGQFHGSRHTLPACGTGCTAADGIHKVVHILLAAATAQI